VDRVDRPVLVFIAAAVTPEIVRQVRRVREVRQV
jgi:hypothetical protein